MNRKRRLLIPIFLAALVAAISPSAALASTAPGLGTAASFAILAGTPVISNTGATVVSGSVGIFPAASVTGFPPGVVNNGTIQAGTAAVGTAKSDLTAAYGVAASSPCNFNKTGVDLGNGTTLTPGTYCQTTAPPITGTLTLSGNGVFIFQIGSTLSTATGSTVNFANGAQPCNVFWQVSSSANLLGSNFVGTIMALTDITFGAGVTLAGRALARNGEVTLIQDQITAPTTCNAVTVVGPSPTPTPGLPATGVPSDLSGAFPLLLLIGIGTGGAALALAISSRRRRRSSV